MSLWITVKKEKMIWNDNWGVKKISSKIIPPLPGIYVMYFKYGEIYIGSSINLSQRMRGHNGFKKTGNIHEFSGLKYKICKKFGSWLMDEARLIRKLNPCLNKKTLQKIR